LNNFCNFQKAAQRNNGPINENSPNQVTLITRTTQVLHLALQRTAQQGRVARFFLVHDTKTGKRVPNEQRMYLMVVKYAKCP
jgi:hypothetical protein